MTLIYGGSSYRITCKDGLHSWVRQMAPNKGRIFAQKPCDCERLKELGIKLPMQSALKVALHYMAPGRQVTIGRYVDEGASRG